MIRRPPRSTLDRSSAASDVYKRQVGYCLDANTGKILWTVDLPGTDPVQTAGIFSDATAFAPIADGERVWFFNRCGSMGLSLIHISEPTRPY